MRTLIASAASITAIMLGAVIPYTVGKFSQPMPYLNKWEDFKTYWGVGLGQIIGYGAILVFASFVAGGVFTLVHHKM